MMYSKSLPPLAILAGLALASCDVRIQNGKASFGVYSAQATSEWTHRYPLTPGGRVEIVAAGDQVEVGAGQTTDVEVHATVTAKALTDAGARDLLLKGAIKEIAEPNRVHIETVSPPRDVRGTYSVHYQILLPAGADTQISANGDLKVVGIVGKLKITSSNGRVDVADVEGELDGLVAGGVLTVSLKRVTAPVRLETTSGRLSLSLPASTKAHLSANVINGRMAVSGLQLGDQTGRRIRTIDTDLNGGGPDINLRVSNGVLSIDGR